MKSSLLTIRGTRLYVEQYNEDCKVTLLYLHGGPGASCVDFCYYQAKALSNQLRVVAIDQRGVLRSDPIHKDEQFGIEDIINDLEELRIQLGINNWILLGHSFGGYLAVKYALDYPNSIRKIIFEAPCFDVRSATRSIISKAREHFEKNSNQDGIIQCNEYLDSEFTAGELWNSLGSVFELLGEDKDLLYFKGITPDDYEEIINSRISSNDMWNKNKIHNEKLQDEGKFFENQMPELSALTHPTMLITGSYDPVCCSDQQHAYLSNIRNGKVVEFKHSAHFPRLEEPNRYTNEVLNFIFS
ncbi:alpha/beta fold hydrolase [Paenibacillus sp. EC2-1]|uniref:alpha/beta fold hydrolase n=1 Tax=Paenibacillus sp. EC2-1 TaxID=3388665 RepID=UPI003BEF0C58